MTYFKKKNFPSQKSNFSDFQTQNRYAETAVVDIVLFPKLLETLQSDDLLVPIAHPTFSQTSCPHLKGLSSEICSAESGINR
jgi:hypothetical protein